MPDIKLKNSKREAKSGTSRLASLILTEKIVYLYSEVNTADNENQYTLMLKENLEKFQRNRKILKEKEKKNQKKKKKNC